MQRINLFVFFICFLTTGKADADCQPEKGTNQEECERMGCTWNSLEVMVTDRCRRNPQMLHNLEVKSRMKRSNGSVENTKTASISPSASAGNNEKHNAKPTTVIQATDAAATKSATTTAAKSISTTGIATTTTAKTETANAKKTAQDLTSRSNKSTASLTTAAPRITTGDSKPVTSPPVKQDDKPTARSLPEGGKSSPKQKVGEMDSPAKTTNSKPAALSSSQVSVSEPSSAGGTASSKAAATSSSAVVTEIATTTTAKTEIATSSTTVPASGATSADKGKDPPEITKNLSSNARTPEAPPKDTSSLASMASLTYLILIAPLLLIKIS